MMCTADYTVIYWLLKMSRSRTDVNLMGHQCVLMWDDIKWAGQCLDEGMAL
jgi:hypothetical protein